MEERINRLFCWDLHKAELNLKKHGITFERATEVFTDPNVISQIERIENGEERWQSVGMVEGLYILLVAHTVLSFDDDGNYFEKIRIISARKADKKERKAYANGHF